MTAENTPGWPPRQESNLYLPLRRRPFYPLNYGGSGPDSRIPPGTGRKAQFQRQVQITSSELSSPDCARSVKRWAMR